MVEAINPTKTSREGWEGCHSNLKSGFQNEVATTLKINLVITHLLFKIVPCKLSSVSCRMMNQIAQIQGQK